MQALADGKFNFIAECSPLLGPQLMDLVKKVVKGETIPTAHPDRGDHLHPGAGQGRAARAASTKNQHKHDQTNPPSAEERVVLAHPRRQDDPHLNHAHSRAKAGTMPAPQPILTMTGISKSFPGVRALSEVDFRLFPGEVHALMGENGAGKSTLIKVLTGVYSIDEGDVVARRRAGRASRARWQAQQGGVSTVYQEVNLCPNLSVAENIFIGREPRAFGRIQLGARCARGRASCWPARPRHRRHRAARLATRWPSSRWWRSPGPSTSRPRC